MASSSRWESGDAANERPVCSAARQGRETALLTTQLYFRGEPLNLQDSIFSDSLVKKVVNATDASRRAAFAFVLAPRASA